MPSAGAPATEPRPTHQDPLSRGIGPKTSSKAPQPTSRQARPLTSNAVASPTTPYFSALLEGMWRLGLRSHVNVGCRQEMGPGR